MEPSGLAAHCRSFAPPPMHHGQTYSFLSRLIALKYYPISEIEKIDKELFRLSVFAGLVHVRPERVALVVGSAYDVAEVNCFRRLASL